MTKQTNEIIHYTLHLRLVQQQRFTLLHACRHADKCSVRKKLRKKAYWNFNNARILTNHCIYELQTVRRWTVPAEQSRCSSRDLRGHLGAQSRPHQVLLRGKSWSPQVHWRPHQPPPPALSFLWIRCFTKTLMDFSYKSYVAVCPLQHSKTIHQYTKTIRAICANYSPIFFVNRKALHSEINIRLFEPLFVIFIPVLSC